MFLKRDVITMHVVNLINIPPSKDGKDNPRLHQRSSHHHNTFQEAVRLSKQIQKKR